MADISKGEEPEGLAGPVTVTASQNSDEPVKLTDDQRKHLDMIQAVITRLAGASFQMKGWAITTLTAILGAIIAAKLPGWIAIVGLVPAVLFWELDASYLHQERMFRALFRHAVAVYRKDDEAKLAAYNGIGSPEIYTLDPVPYAGLVIQQSGEARRAKTIQPLYRVIAGIYLVFAIVGGIVALRGGSNDSPKTCACCTSAPTPSSPSSVSALTGDKGSASPVPLH